jgi:hypothetical protein
MLGWSHLNFICSAKVRVWSFVRGTPLTSVRLLYETPGQTVTIPAAGGVFDTGAAAFAAGTPNKKTAHEARATGTESTKELIDRFMKRPPQSWVIQRETFSR